MLDKCRTTETYLIVFQLSGGFFLKRSGLTQRLVLSSLGFCQIGPETIRGLLRAFDMDFLLDSASRKQMGPLPAVREAPHPSARHWTSILEASGCPDVPAALLDFFSPSDHQNT